MDAESLAERLNGRREGKDWRCECPLHNNARHLIITDKGDKPVWHCMGGASNDEVTRVFIELGLWEGGDSHESSVPRGHIGERAGEPMLVEEYEYRGIDGNVIAIKGRFVTAKGKDFRWRMPDKGWTGLNGLAEEELPFYGSENLCKEGTVFICEGEKAARACMRNGLLALCPPGSASAKKFGTALEPLAGRDVVLWPDNDDVGRGLMRRIKERLTESRVRVVAPPVPEAGGG